MSSFSEGGSWCRTAPDLEHHHADCVGDDVVELARDPRALLCDGDTCRRLALALGLGRAHFGRLGLHRALAQGVAGEPADPEFERNEDEVAGRSARGCCRPGPRHSRARSASRSRPASRRAGSRAGTRGHARRRRGCCDERDAAVRRRTRSPRRASQYAAGRGERDTADGRGAAGTNKATAGTTNNSASGGALGVSSPDHELDQHRDRQRPRSAARTSTRA